MRTFSNRIWVLMLGIAVAVIIATAAILLGDSSSSAFSISPSKKISPSSATLAKRILEKIHLKVLSR